MQKVVYNQLIVKTNQFITNRSLKSTESRIKARQMFILSRFDRIKSSSYLATLIFSSIHYSKQGTFTASPDTVFEVVKRTQRYSEFIPWCSKSTITKYISPQQNYTSLTIAFQKVKELSYLSHVQISGDSNEHHNRNLSYSIKSTCRQQPLSSLVSIWQIEKDAIIDGNLQLSNVRYSIQYEFSSPILQLTSHFFLDYVGEAMWVIFKEQAEKKQLEIRKLVKKKQGEGEITFGMSNKYYQRNGNQNKQQQQTFTTTQNATSNLATNLTQYLDKNTQIHKIYSTNSQFRNKLDKWGQILQGTNDFEMKLQFKIKNYLIHKN